MTEFKAKRGGLIAVIDTETNWEDKIMSVGAVIADSIDFTEYDRRYYILSPEYLRGGMFSDMLYLQDKDLNVKCSRTGAVTSVRRLLDAYGVENIFAYNAGFDAGHMPELSCFNWYDIMKIAAYRKFNRFIPESCACFKTGRMKTGYGVENMIRIVTGIENYAETHNALVDALDELQIMRFLGQKIDVYYDNACILHK